MTQYKNTPNKQNNKIDHHQTLKLIISQNCALKTMKSYKKTPKHISNHKILKSQQKSHLQRLCEEYLSTHQGSKDEKMMHSGIFQEKSEALFWIKKDIHKIDKNQLMRDLRARKTKQNQKIQKQKERQRETKREDISMNSSEKLGRAMINSRTVSSNEKSKIFRHARIHTLRQNAEDRPLSLFRDFEQKIPELIKIKTVETESAKMRNTCQIPRKHCHKYQTLNKLKTDSGYPLRNSKLFRKTLITQSYQPKLPTTTKQLNFFSAEITPW